MPPHFKVPSISPTNPCDLLLFLTSRGRVRLSLSKSPTRLSLSKSPTKLSVIGTFYEADTLVSPVFYLSSIRDRVRSSRSSVITEAFEFLFALTEESNVS